MKLLPRQAIDLGAPETTTRRLFSWTWVMRFSPVVQSHQFVCKLAVKLAINNCSTCSYCNLQVQNWQVVVFIWKLHFKFDSLMLTVDMFDKSLGLLGRAANCAGFVDVPGIDCRSKKGGDVFTFELVRATCDCRGASGCQSACKGSLQRR